MGGNPDFWEGEMESRAETEKKLSFFQGSQWQLFIFCIGRIEALFLHIVDPNNPSFYLKCPKKYQNTYNFDIFPTLPQICTSPPPKFCGKS